MAVYAGTCSNSPSGSSISGRSMLDGRRQLLSSFKRSKVSSSHTHTPVSQPLDNFSVIFIYSPNPTFLVNSSKDTVSKAGHNSAICTL